MKSAPTLKIQVVETVNMKEGTAPSAVNRPVPSPYFQPHIDIRVEEQTMDPSGKPRGPTVIIDMCDLMAAFE